MADNTVDPIERISNGMMKTLLYALREIAHLTRDVGMPIATFAAGITLLFTRKDDTFTDIIIATGLITLGLLTQMWVYARENPARKGDEFISHLKQITKMAEQISSTDKKQNPILE